MTGAWLEAGCITRSRLAHLMGGRVRVSQGLPADMAHQAGPGAGAVGSQQQRLTSEQHKTTLEALLLPVGFLIPLAPLVASCPPEPL